MQSPFAQVQATENPVHYDQVSESAKHHYPNFVLAQTTNTAIPIDHFSLFGACWFSKFPLNPLGSDRDTR